MSYGKNRSIIGELQYLAKSVGVIAQSQLGYDVRHLNEPVKRRLLKAAVAGGNVVDANTPRTPDESVYYQQENVADAESVSDLARDAMVSATSFPLEAIDRAKVVGAGVEVFAKLAYKGVFPGYGGYELSPLGEKLFPKSQPLTSPPSSSSTLFPSAPPPTERISFTTQQDTVEDPIPSRSEISNSKTDEMVALGAKEGMTPEEEAFLRKAAREVGVIFPDTTVERHDQAAAAKASPLPPKKTTAKPVISQEFYRPTIPKNYRPSTQKKAPASQLEHSHERSVPSSRLARLASFGRLAIGLSTGAAAEVTRRTLGIGQVKPEVYGAKSAISSEAQRETTAPQRPSSEQGSPWLTPANAERIVETLCRVRGAALKLGQMLSIQDEETVPAYLLQIFERVRQSADFMPAYQVNAQMKRELGENWRQLFKEFDERPFAAASIGQVHLGVALDGRKVAVKVQYPGVAEGIDSDIDNLLTILNLGGLIPRGMFLDNFATVARRELKAECDYEREARAMCVFRKLLQDDPDFYVPGVYPELSTKRVITAEFVEGTPVDLCEEEPQAVRDYIASKYVELCLKEVFIWRFMQTDPNWSNFLFGIHPSTGSPALLLLDFGASRSYPKAFVDKYIRIIRAAQEKDRENILKWSCEADFLTGYESKAMQNAHIESISILGECLYSKGPFDFSKQRVTSRINQLVPVMLQHRLTAPPDEVYSLHRKLSGSFLLATKLRAVVSCGAMFEDIYQRYKFGDDPHHPPIDIDSPTSSDAVEATECHVETETSQAPTTASQAKRETSPI